MFAKTQAIALIGVIASVTVSKPIPPINLPGVGNYGKSGISAVPDLVNWHGLPEFPQTSSSQNTSPSSSTSSSPSGQSPVGSPYTPPQGASSSGAPSPSQGPSTSPSSSHPASSPAETPQSASPVPDSGAGAGAAYNCGCASRKTQLEGMGATAFDLAVGFQETGSALSGTAYAYGDGKTQDSANFGMFKNNWFMIRSYCSQFKGQSVSEWNNGAVLNSDDAAAVKCLNEQIAALGQDKWFSGQRWGATGINGQADQSDINNYKTGVTTIEGYLNQGHLTDNMATSYNVPGV